MATSFDVRIWAIRAYKGKKKTTYSVRWAVGGKEFFETFGTKALAESFRASLLSATRKGEAFDTETGLPQSAVRQANTITWYELAVKFCDMKWKRWAPGSRASGAEALATVTSALVKGRNAPSVEELRHALEKWAFNKTAREAGNPPEEYAVAIGWLRENSVSVHALIEAATVRLALDALSTKLDGKAAAANTANRKRMVFHQALEYGVELGYLDANPLDQVKWKAPKTADAIDRRSVVNPTQARSLLKAVADTDDRLTVFFALMYFAALRPSETADLRVTDCELPDTGWGMLYLARSIPNSGAAWTDSGKPQESRSLKHRAKEAVRTVPACPEFVRYIKQHIQNHGIATDGRLVRGAEGGRVPEAAYGRAWRSARRAVLSASQVASPLGEASVRSPARCGIDLTERWRIADDRRRVGRTQRPSPPAGYAKCIDGQDALGRRLIEDALGTPEPPKDDPQDNDQDEEQPES